MYYKQSPNNCLDTGFAHGFTLIRREKQEKPATKAKFSGINNFSFISNLIKLRIHIIYTIQSMLLYRKRIQQ